MAVDYDVAVVGAGLGGLSAAALLARAGRRVIVVERNKAPGGYAQAFRRGPYTFDPAIHATGEVEFLSNLLRFAGVEDRVEFLPVDTLFGMVYPDLRMTLPFGLEPVTEALASRFPDEKAGIRRLLALRDQIFLEASQLPHQLGLRDLDAAAERFPTFFRYRSATVQEAVAEHLVDPRLQSLIASMWPYLGTPPSRASFLFFSQILGTLIEGTYYVRGSFQTLVDAFVAAIEAQGGEVILDCEVTGIAVEDGAVRGLELADGHSVSASTVVSNADATHTLKKLVGEDHLPKPYVSKLDRLMPALSAFSIYTATTMDLAALGAAHETFVFRHWDHDESYGDIMAGRPGGMWISAPSMVDPSLAPPGEHTVVLTTLARFDAADWHAEADRFADLLLDELDWVFPGFRATMTLLVPATPRTFQRYAGTRDGAVYGWEATPRQIANGRLPHETPVPGLFLSGAWTQQAHGCLRVIVSGEQVARLVLRTLEGADRLPSFRPAHLPPLSV